MAKDKRTLAERNPHQTMHCVMRFGNVCWKFDYKNYRGEIATRVVQIEGIDYGSNDYYPEPCWLLRCYDIEKGSSRSFAFSNIDPNTIEIATIEDQMRAHEKCVRDAKD